MNNSCVACCIVFVSVIFCFCTKISLADSDNLQDTCPTSSLGKQTIFVNGFPCKNPNNISAPDFKTSKLTQPGDTDNFFGSAENLVTAAEFPGLNTLGLSIALASDLYTNFVNYLTAFVNFLLDDSFADVKLSSVVNDEVLYHWGGRDIMRKVIVITSCLPRDVDSMMQKTLTAAAEKCVSVEFLLFEQKSSHLSNAKENINSFVTCISELDNCSDPRVLHGLVNRWLQDLKDDIEEPLQARFNFKQNLVGSVCQISCNLYISVNQIVDGFYPSGII